MVSRDDSLPGRSGRVSVPDAHHVSGAPLEGTFDGMAFGMFGMGCFWGAERKFWQAKGVHSTSVGYAGGFTVNPTYHEVCSGMTGHTEVVRVVFDPAVTSFAVMLQLFWENHDPTQGLRQGNDVGSQYRSAIYAYGEEQLRVARASRESFQRELAEAGHGSITTEVELAPDYYFAEAYHQQYLAKNPGGYCGIGGIGVSCPIGVLEQA